MIHMTVSGEREKGERMVEEKCALWQGAYGEVEERTN